MNLFHVKQYGHLGAGTQFRRFFAIAVVICLPLDAVLAQHAMHDMGAEPAMTVHSTPADDAVLPAAPQSLQLHFPETVRLVKLAVRDPGSGLTDIGFRYDPKSSQMYTQALPVLETADYYTVEWAVLDGNEQLVKGNFHFAFGPDARPPSYYLAQREQMRHFMAPDYRLLDPSAQ
ncbi:MAG: copper resistance CopC family protein [Pseudohongiellaceae bacterium]